MMRPIRVLCLAGGAAALAGALVLWLSFLMGPGETSATLNAQTLLSVTGLLFASVGGFLFLCTAPVLAIGLLTQPRARAEERAR